MLWRRRSVLVFFAIGFGVPWLGWTVYALSGLDSGQPLARMLFYTGDFMTVGGLVAAWVAGGGKGLRHLLSRAIRIRVPLVWALFALFLPLLIWLTTYLIYGATHDGIGRFDPSGFAAYGSVGVLVALTTGPLGEEAGWRGFLLPRMLTRYGPLPAALVLGLIWSVWHYPLYFRAAMSTLAGFTNFTVAVLCFSTLLMVLWAHTSGSLFWAVVLHWTINISEGVVQALLPDVRPPTGATSLLELVVLAVATVVVVAVVGTTRLKQRLGQVMAGLVPESIDQDANSRSG
ncbi:MAG: CPBP family intramembrane glutamic endopeptidase [Gemmatimonadales bacterium]